MSCLKFNAFVIFILLNSNSQAQNQTVVKFYDVDWQESMPAKATYRAEFKRDSNDYRCVSYWLATGKIRGISTYRDTFLTKAKALQRLYNQNGSLEDSIFFYEDGRIKRAYAFYSNGQLECHYEANEEGDRFFTEAYTEAGKRIRKYVYFRSAEPKDGLIGWQRFIREVSDPSLTASPGMPLTAEVIIRFWIDETGKVSSPTVLRSCGMAHVDNEAVQIIKASPRWEPAIFKNKPIKVTKVQTFTFELRTPYRRF